MRMQSDEDAACPAETAAGGPPLEQGPRTAALGVQRLVDAQPVGTDDHIRGRQRRLVDDADQCVVKVRRYMVRELKREHIRRAIDRTGEPGGCPAPFLLRIEYL